MATRSRRRVRRREAETDGLQRHFEEVGAGKRNNLFAAPPWKDRNPLVRLLAEAHVATGEPVFAEALKIAALYGFTEAAEPVRRMKEVGDLLSSLKAIPFVEAELQRQKVQGERRSERKAFERAAVLAAIEAPTLEAARKRVERTWKAHLLGNIPDGYTGSEVLCAAASETGPMSWKLSHLSWERDDARNRKCLETFQGIVLKKMYTERPATAEETMDKSPPALQAEICREIRQWNAQQLGDGAAIGRTQAHIRAMADVLGRHKIDSSGVPSYDNSPDAAIADAIFAACGFYDQQGNKRVDPSDVETLMRVVLDTGSMSMFPYEPDGSGSAPAEV